MNHEPRTSGGRAGRLVHFCKAKRWLLLLLLPKADTELQQGYL